MSTNPRIIRNPNGGDVAGIKNSIITKTADYTILDNDGYVYIKASGSGTDITLPAPANNVGRTIAIERTDASNVITVKRAASENFVWQGNNIGYDLPLNYGDVIQVQSDGTNWVVLKYTGLGQNNIVINGGIDFSQRGASFPSTSGGVTTLDRWFYQGNLTTGLATITKGTSTVSKTGNSLKYTATSAVSSLATNDYLLTSQIIEGVHSYPLVGGVINVSFWIRTTIAGTTCVSIRNGAADRSYVVPVAVTAPNTWEFKSLPIYLNPTGTWPSDSTNGLRLAFAVAAGTGFSSTSNNQWLAGNTSITSTQTNFMVSINNTYEIADIQINSGCLSSGFRRFGQTIAGELAACQRYYEKSYPVDVAPATVNNAIGIESRVVPNNTVANQQPYGSISFAVTKRITPTTVNIYGYNGGSAGIVSRQDTGANLAAASGSVRYTGTRGCEVYNGAAAQTTANQSVIFHWTADAEF